MSTIISEETRHEWTVWLCSDGGQDIMPDILSASPDVTYCSAYDEAGVASDDDAQWWAQWCERERRINAALESCDDAARAAAFAAIDRAGGDWDSMQRMECAALGVDYDVDVIGMRHDYGGNSGQSEQLGVPTCTSTKGPGMKPGQHAPLMMLASSLPPQRRDRA